ncbi:MAG: glycerophosphodiester phosphodiesterase [Acidiferrobacteraceae bacterium]|nr:glycerophosphodiester phosphodiesterase [Acidiferrobacteraceae bacterium]
MKTIAIHGHRGARGYAPENTLASFQLAIEQNASGIELDVSVTRDKQIIIYHDPYINPDTTREPNGTAVLHDKWRIYDMQLKRIQQFDVGCTDPTSNYGSQFPNQIPVPGQKIPTLRQLFIWLERIDSPETVVNIEIKSDPRKPHCSPPPAEFASLVLEEIRRAPTTNPVWIQSFDWRLLREVQIQNPRIPTGYLTSQQPFFDTVTASEHGQSPWLAGYDPYKYNDCLPRAIYAAGGHYWGPDYRDLSAELVAAAQSNYLTIHAWTVNLYSDVVTLVDLGVDGITSDYPKSAIEASSCIAGNSERNSAHKTNVTQR